MVLPGSADETIKNWYCRFMMVCFCECVRTLSYKPNCLHMNQSMCVFARVFVGEGARKVRRKFTVEKAVHTIYYSKAHLKQAHSLPAIQTSLSYNLCMCQFVRLEICVHRRKEDRAEEKDHKEEHKEYPKRENWTE